jgi:hypothetical protein
VVDVLNLSYSLTAKRLSEFDVRMSGLDKVSSPFHSLYEYVETVYWPSPGAAYIQVGWK